MAYEIGVLDVINDDRGTPSDGCEGLKQFLAAGLAAMPALRARIEDIVAEGDRVVVHSTMHRTNQGAFMRTPAIGTVMTVTGM